MLIQCTKALLDKLNIDKNKLVAAEGHEQFPESFAAWHANLININRRKAIILMNNESRYSVVIYRPTPKDFTRIDKLIKEAIIVALRMEGVDEDVIGRYIDKAGEISFSKTANRSMVAKLNNAVREIEFMMRYLDENSKTQRFISILTGRFIQGSVSDEGYYPIDKMIECLNMYCNDERNDLKAILDIDLYQLKIQIEMDGFDIWRRVLVPSIYSFRHLHSIIQTVFDWQNYHLHQFEAKKEGAKTKQIIMDDDPETIEWLDFETYDIIQERFVALYEILPEFGEVTYQYDFGDNWEHTITLEKVIKSNEFKATLLEGSGERPPEDVGGSWGYQEYMRIMSDESDPDYEDMKIWSNSQKEKKLSPEEMKHRLSRAITGFGY